MKKLVLLMFAFMMSLAFVSCSSDDDSDGQPQFNIVGTWKVTAQYINNNQQDISDICAFKGNVKFINGGTFTEDVWTEEEGVACHLDETIGGTWIKNGNSYSVNITSQGGESILPATFTPVITNNDISKFEISETSLGTTTKLVFTKQ